ncbi:efflux RND transporter permease subunit [Mucilaginibacter sp. L3T2-6]|uniref:efflux RND transporter permease subunit n=1 Tax=Mucilaginibacter sp. L3T2-6 TaxID=3062491 RepID=UPI00267567CB|nr:efflux RND transporter permease subunit [Mucilaginibacter sp. L3T2-6]MDO3640571.1 efflux RND transporter permease subunit [Mucilaginibacter sp. L3T2-6]MDV6213090.1 efflux RND transporter permease subunit [Mucilaginibacter sp. L3T2-6]
MKPIKETFLQHSKPVSLVLVIILLAGIFAYSKLQSSLFPEITFPKIKVIAEEGLQPVNKMMVTVTKPLENAIKQVPGLQNVRSTTSRGSCEISAFMDWNADIDVSMQKIQASIDQVKNDLPADVNITVAKMNPSILPVSGYTLESHSRDPIELKQLATYTVKPFLSQVDGVSEIRVIGGKAKEYWLTLNKQKMSALGLTPDIISTTLGTTNFVKSEGYLSDYKRMYLTVTDATINAKDQLENLVISNNKKRVVRLKDFADVAIQPGIEYTRINANGRDGVLIAVIKQPDANLVSLSADMDSKVAELQKILPKDVTIKPYYEQADFVNDSIKSVSDSLWIGLLLAIIVAIIFLRSIKASAVILITIPVTLCFSLAVIYSVGYTLNIMTLGAIAAALGLIIDDAIVVVEQIHRTHEEHPRERALKLIKTAIDYLFPAMLGSSISTIVIFIPFLLMTGVAGAYFHVLTNTMIITLACSFFVTWIGLPVIYVLLSRRKPNNTAQQKTGEHHIKKQRWVNWFILRPLVSIIIIVAAVLAIIFVPPLLETGFLPEMDEGSIVLDYTSPPGTSLDETDRMLRQIEQIIVKQPEVAAYSRRTGTEMGFFITEPNKGDYLISLKKSRDKSTEEVISDLRKKIAANQPALRIDFGQVIGDMLGDLMTSVQPIEIKIFGDNQQRLQSLSKQVAGVVEGVKGTADVFDGIVIAGPSVSIDPHYSQLAQYNITPASLQFQLQTALEGNIIGNMLEREQLSPIRMVYPGNRALNVTGIQNQTVFVPSGKLIPISELANVQLKPGEAEINRENLQSIGIVSARLEGADLGSVMPAIQRNIAKNVSLPQGYHVEYGGDYAQQQQSFKELLIILITSSLLVFAVILFLFKQFRIAFLILIVAVLGIAGSFLALYITQTPLNVGSYTGLIMIVGIIGENAIFTFLQFKERALENADKGVENGIDEAVVFSISTRLRPKLMTAIGAIIALMPLALGIGAGAQLHQPLAIAVIGGFLAALPLLLIVLPSLMRILYRNGRFHENTRHELIEGAEG